MMQVDFTARACFRPELLLRHNIKVFLGPFKPAAIAAEPQHDRRHNRNGKQLREYNRGQLRDVKCWLQQWHPCMRPAWLALTHRLSHYHTKPIAHDDDAQQAASTALSR
jgi:hypothetical protein